MLDSWLLCLAAHGLKTETFSIFDAAYCLLYQSLHIKSDTTLATLHTMAAYILPSTQNVVNAIYFTTKPISMLFTSVKKLKHLVVEDNLYSYSSSSQ